MSVMLFIVVLIASFIIVRIGAVAFQLTGLEWSLAKFQSLSCFSGTGFTTKEAELITDDIYAAECVEQKRTPFFNEIRQNHRKTD